MFKVVANETLGDGTVLFFQNPLTNDFVCSIDGVDNEKYVSWHGIREGVVGFPTCINHMDLWLNSVYNRNELEGFAKFKDESDDAWDYKEREILAKFATWQRVAVCGRVSADGNVLQFVNTSGDFNKSKDIIEYMLNRGLIEESTRLFINNKDFDSVGKFLVVSAQCALFAKEEDEGEKNVLTSKVLIQAQLEQEKKTAKHTQELMDLLDKYRQIKSQLGEWKMTEPKVDPLNPEKAAKPRRKFEVFKHLSDEQKEDLKQQMQEIMKPTLNFIYEDYYPLIIREVSNKAGTYDMRTRPNKNEKVTENLGRPETSVDYFAPAILSTLTKQFLDHYDASKGSITNFVVSRLSGSGKNKGGIINNLLEQENRLNKQYMTVGPGFAEDDGGAEVGSAGDVAGSNDPVANVTDSFFGKGPREDAPAEQVMTKDLKPLLDRLQNVLSPKELDFINKFYYEGKSLEQIGEEYGGQTRQNMSLLNRKILDKLQTPEILKKLSLAKKKFPLSIK